ncbi:MAG: hypothetical protein KatS3mg063_2694 [Tepidiforma sp.]|uniref:hypothetical protein n=1 Tax=Tepidiforma sp. TaxID=2682230 RepID=UPI001803A472|nr:hypothetical protein [Tepidiforma sp.]GIW16841.1 MAG: hypothetical protein KatS3mg063_2694 [Tepidiforma sp.]
MGTASVRITGERLRAMADNGMNLYLTPGASAPYWASGRQFAHDQCVATPWDVLKANGYHDVDEPGDDEVLDIEVELIDR